MSDLQGTKILFLVTEDWFFCSHRLPVARAARDAGADVFVMTKTNAHAEQISNEGFSVIPWRNISRGSLNPVQEVRAFFEVLAAYRRIQPDIVHHVAIKPVVYGGLAAHFVSKAKVINAITGLGLVFSSNDKSMQLLRVGVKALMRAAMPYRRTRVICQNQENLDLLIASSIIGPGDACVIRGSGVDTNVFCPSPEPSGVPQVIIATRMLWPKGVGVFVEAAKKLKASAVQARFALVGPIDPENPRGISEKQLQEWNDSGVIEWWGARTDMPQIFRRCNVVCFPSCYGEGIPKVLIEAAACGRAVITTDVLGCREAVRDGQNGLLVPPNDPDALAGAISTLLSDSAMRARMGRAGRQRAVAEFAADRIVTETLAVYRQCLKKAAKVEEYDSSVQVVETR